MIFASQKLKKLILPFKIIYIKYDDSNGIIIFNEKRLEYPTSKNVPIINIYRKKANIWPCLIVFGSKFELKNG